MTLRRPILVMIARNLAPARERPVFSTHLAQQLVKIKQGPRMSHPRTNAVVLITGKRFAQSAKHIHLILNISTGLSARSLAIRLNLNERAAKRSTRVLRTAQTVSFFLTFDGSCVHDR